MLACTRGGEDGEYYAKKGFGGMENEASMK